MHASITTKRFAIAAIAALAIAALFGIRATIVRHGVEGVPVPLQPVVERLELGKTRTAMDAASVSEVAQGAPRAQAMNEAAFAPPEPQGAPLHLLPPPPRGGRGPSQLIRTASVSLEVADVSRALQGATLVADDELGDVIGLSDDTPSSNDQPHTATMTIRVPQYRFEQTLAELGRLGKVTATSVSAQDVSDQIIDAQARLRNLRRTEADMLAIMDRSGNIDQVLNVTQQIASVREQIERLDAQIQGMQYQVAYSNVSISFTSPATIATAPTAWALLGLAWQHAIAAARDFGVSLASFVLWIVAFAPYVLVLAAIAWFVARRVRSIPLASTKPNG
jgi:Domain of unknown function (DUF4349)